MSKTILSAATILMFFFLSTSFQAKSATLFISKPSHSLIVGDDSVKILQIQKRVLEIQSMDFSKLSASEKKALRKELKKMAKEAKKADGGGQYVYISVGALIVIILLLILILR